jgi:hypothetical protein
MRTLTFACIVATISSVLAVTGIGILNGAPLSLPACSVLGVAIGLPAGMTMAKAEERSRRGDPV